MKFWLEHLLVENSVWLVEESVHASEGEVLVNPVAESACQDLLTIVLEVLQFVEAALFNEEICITVFWNHACPNLRDKDRDIVVEARVSDIASSSAKALITREDEAKQRIVEVRCAAEHVERSLGQCTLTACSSRRWRLACQRAGEVHEELWQLLIMYRVVDTQRTNTILLVCRIVSAARHYGVDNVDNWLIGVNLAVQANSNLCHVCVDILH